MWQDEMRGRLECLISQRVASQPHRCIIIIIHPSIHPSILIPGRGRDLERRIDSGQSDRCGPPGHQRLRLVCPDAMHDIHIVAPRPPRYLDKQQPYPAAPLHYEWIDTWQDFYNYEPTSSFLSCL